MIYKNLRQNKYINMEEIIRKEIKKATKKFLITLNSYLQDSTFNVDSELVLLDSWKYKVVKEKKAKKCVNNIPYKIGKFIENKRPIIVCEEIRENLILVENFIVDEKTCCALYKIVDGVQLKLDKKDMEKCTELNLDFKFEM